MFRAPFATWMFGLCWLLGASSAKAQGGGERKVSVGAHALHLVEAGDGSYTVIFESGFGTDLSVWRKVVPEIAKEARVVAYSRAGYGKSETAPATPTLVSSVRDLEGLVQAAALKPPFILVSHSYGAFVHRGFAARHPESVAGMVFVDPSSERFYPELRKLDAVRFAQDQRHAGAIVPARFKAEYEALEAWLEKGQAPENGPLPDVPVAVLSSVKPRSNPEFFFQGPEGVALWRRLHAEFFARFSNGHHMVTPHSGHNIHLEESHLVVEAIRQVIAEGGREARRAALKQALLSAQQALGQAGEWIRQGRWDRAEQEAFMALAKLQLPEAETNLLGYDYLGKRGKPELAALLFKHNRQAFPQSPNACDSYGEALMALGRPGEAKAQFLRAISLAEPQGPQHPGLAGYRKNLAKAEQALGGK